MSEVRVSRVLLPRECRLHLACLYRRGRPLASLTVCCDSTRELAIAVASRPADGALTGYGRASTWLLQVQLWPVAHRPGSSAAGAAGTHTARMVTSQLQRQLCRGWVSQQQPHQCFAG